MALVEVAKAQPIYSVTDLGELSWESEFNYAISINDSGLAVEHSGGITGNPAFLWNSE